VYPVLPQSQLKTIIDGRLVGGSGKYPTTTTTTTTRSQRRNTNTTSYSNRSNSRALIDPSTTSVAINVLARLTSWLLFPLICDVDDVEDDIALCDKTKGLKLLATGQPQFGYDDGSVGTHSEEDNDDEDGSSSVSSASVSDLPARTPAGAMVPIDSATEREFSEMNVSVSEIAEAYYAHQLIDQERQYRNQRNDTSNSSSRSDRRNSSSSNRSGLTVTEETTIDVALDHRLDYEITQMDIARMARNASRHLDVDSILNLPTVTYQSRSSAGTQRNGTSGAAAARRGTEQSYHHVCSPVHSDAGQEASSPTREDAWSFVMVSGVKSTTQGALESYYRTNTNQESRKSGDDVTGENDDVCVICLDAFQHGDRLRVLPCDHSFHVGCIDRWLSGSHSYNECYTAGCPTCKKRPSSSQLLTGQDEDVQDTEHAMDGSVPSWAFAKLGSAMAMSQGW